MNNEIKNANFSSLKISFEKRYMIMAIKNPKIMLFILTPISVSPRMDVDIKLKYAIKGGFE
jgi:hypothetical protein